MAFTIDHLDRLNFVGLLFGAGAVQRREENTHIHCLILGMFEVFVTELLSQFGHLVRKEERAARGSRMPYLGCLPLLSQPAHAG
jgi:hypothetical protein